MVLIACRRPFEYFEYYNNLQLVESKYNTKIRKTRIIIMPITSGHYIINKKNDKTSIGMNSQKPERRGIAVFICV